MQVSIASVLKMKDEVLIEGLSAFIDVSITSVLKLKDEALIEGLSAFIDASKYH